MDSRRPPPLVNTYVKDHFWPHEFIQTFKQSQRLHSSRTFEDLHLTKPLQPIELPESLINQKKPTFGTP